MPLELRHVIGTMGQRCKSADPVGMGVSALNEDDDDGDDYGIDGDRRLQGEPRSSSGFAGSGRHDAGASVYGAPAPSFDMDRLTLPPGMQRGVAHGDGMPEQPGSQSMLQPMSPGQPPIDNVFAQVPHPTHVRCRLELQAMLQLQALPCASAHARACHDFLPHLPFPHLCLDWHGMEAPC